MTPAPLASEPQTLLPADARAFGVPGRRQYRTRVSRRREGSKLVVFRAVPDGSSRAASQGAFLRAVREAPALDRLRADRRATVLEVAKHLAWTASWDTMTTRPTWAALCERTDRSRSTVARALRTLQEAGLVGVVATGRSAAFVPAARDAGVAEAAVYVLCVPSPLAPVDELDTPTGASPVSETHPPHARASGSPSEPLRGRPVGAPAAPGAHLGPVAGPDSRPADPARHHAPVGRAAEAVPRPPDGPADKRTERVVVARALQDRLPVLRRISDRHVASVVREFVLAGWTVSELVMAIDRRPDGTTWPHDGAAGVGNVGAWLTFRLGAWRDAAGTVRRSPGERLRTERLEAAARRRAEAAARGDLVPAAASPAFAQIRAELAAQRQERGRR